MPTSTPSSIRNCPASRCGDRVSRCSRRVEQGTCRRPARDGLPLNRSSWNLYGVHATSRRNKKNAPRIHARFVATFLPSPNALSMGLCVGGARRCSRGRCGHGRHLIDIAKQTRGPWRARRWRRHDLERLRCSSLSPFYRWRHSRANRATRTAPTTRPKLESGTAQRAGEGRTPSR